MATYSTTAECASYSGMPLCDTTTRPSSTMVDTFRTQAYALIIRIIGSGTTDVDDFAKAMEMKLADMKIQSINTGTPYVMRLTQDEENDLRNHFDCHAIYDFTPNNDGAVTGS